MTVIDHHADQTKNLPTAAPGTAPRPSATPNVVGLDPSLTSTGLATPTGTLAIVPKNGVRGVDRIRHITQAVLGFCDAVKAPLVVVERFVRAAAQTGVHERGGLWWRLVDEIDAVGYPIVLINTSTLKMYATGSGIANKDVMMLATARRFAWFTGGNDEADALWLAAAGCELLERPLVDMPARNREALGKAEWMRGR